MVFGGVPYYWSLLKKGLSLSQNIDELCFSNFAQLKNEFDYLYKSLFRYPRNYEKIVRCLSSKKTGKTFEEISLDNNMPRNGILSETLKNLCACGFVRKYNNLGKKNNGAIYQLVDPFTLFYLKFMDDKSNDENFFSHHISSPILNSWRGLSYELVCLEHIKQIKFALGISGVLTEVCSYIIKEDRERNIKAHQIDLLISRADNVINLCEIKYSSKEYAIDKNDYDDYRTRIYDFIEVSKTRKNIYFTMITSHGLLNNAYSSIVTSSLTIDDLFSC